MLTHKHLLRLSGLLVAIVAVWMIHPDVTFAAVNINKVINNMPTGPEADIAALISKVIAFLNIGIWILFIFLNYVLDPRFIFDLDGNGSFMEMLNQIWQLSRDLMNVVFALCLVGAAIYTIITANKEFVSQHAKKFLLAVILVNFSWFFPRVLIDVANVAASTIYGIPSLLYQGSPSSCSYLTSIDEGNFCSSIIAADPANNTPEIFKCNCRIISNARFFMSHAFQQTLLPSNGWTCLGDILCYQEQAWSPNMVGHSAVLNGLVVNHGHLATMAQVPGNFNAGNVGDMTKFLMVEGLILVIHIAMFFPLLAMFVAFLIRIPILWLTIAFMPFVFLSWSVPDNQYTKSVDEIWQQFLKAAFLPAVVAIPLSVGFILVNAGDQLAAGNAMSNVQIRLIDSVSNFFQLFWWLMTLGVLWAGVFGVLEKAGGLYAKTSQTIKGYGEAWAKVALKAPLAAPIIPGPGGGAAISPLAALHSFNPRAIGAAMSSGKSLKDIVGDLKNGRNPAAGIRLPGHQAGAAGGHLKDPQLTEIDKHLQDLGRELAAAKGDKKQEQAAIDKFETGRGGDLSKLKIDISNPKKSVDDYVRELKKVNKEKDVAKLETTARSF